MQCANTQLPSIGQDLLVVPDKTAFIHAFIYIRIPLSHLPV
jgi:hypothetical protein